MELIPMFLFIIDFLLKINPLYPTIGAIITFLLGYHKNKILEKLNIRQSKAETSQTELQVQTTNISNFSDEVEALKKFNETYKKEFEDFRQYKEAEDVLQREKITNLESQMKSIAGKNLELVQENQAIENEKLHLKDTVDKLEKQVEKLTALIEKLGKKIEYYQTYSGVQLPEHLQDNNKE